MKTFLLILIPFLSIAQYKRTITLQPEQVEAISRDLHNYKFCQEDLQAANDLITSQTKRIEKMAADFKAASDYATTLIQSNDGLWKEKEQLVKDVEKAKQQKNWAVSVFAGYGFYVDDKVALAPMIGVGISRTIFRF